MTQAIGAGTDQAERDFFSDPALIEQILVNLATNALRNTGKGGVLIASRRRGDLIRLEVWDTGSGIAAADLDRDLRCVAVQVSD